MMFLVTFPDNCRAERCWIASVLLDEFLGLNYVIRFDGDNKVRISASDRTLELSDAFFAGVKDKWLGNESLRTGPLQRWTVAENGLDLQLVEPSVPILFGASGFGVLGSGDAALNVDIFGSAFFMLSRYEEAVGKQRDNHDRFPVSASLAYREQFLCRPIIDEYVEILWGAMKKLWPRLERKSRRFKTIVTCDVDQPYHPSAASFSRLIKRTAGEMIRKGTLSDAINPVRNYITSRNGNWKNDPYYYTVDWIMDVNEKAGNAVGFYFIPEVTDRLRDGPYSITDTAVKAMMRRIAYRGHEIGIHPGYNTYQSAKQIFSGKSKLQRVLDQERIQQKVMGGRQHFLRWTTHTPAIWDGAGLTYDSTLGYGDHAGFRCGTCHQYAMYDLHRRNALDVMQRPLICAEYSVIEKMGHGFTESALVEMKKLKSIVQRFNGDFTLLWHNSYFEAAGAREIYCEVIGS
jgi:hypothetical protein